jgi:hypothetical protein
MILQLNKHSLHARKGPRKYFSIKEEYLIEDEKYFEQNDVGNARDDGEYNEIVSNQALRNYTFAPVYRSLKSGNSVTLYRSILTAGEHAQISWIDSEMTWVIASQHASIFIRSLDDLKAYQTGPKTPYHAPAAIATYWLNFFDHSVSNKEEFQKSLNGKTLCGTFVNNSMFEALVKYRKPSLVFHTIVDNDSYDCNCLTPEESYNFFHKWGLDSTPLSNVGTFNSFDSLISQVREVHSSVSNSTLQKDELGTVLYFVENSENPRVLSMGKIETKESL